MKKKIPWKLTFGIVGVFLAGMASSVLIIGIILANVSRRGAEDPKVGEQRMLRTMTKVLELDDQQQREVAAITSDIVADTRTQVGMVIDQHSPRIRAILRPDQTERFDHFLGKVEEHLHVTLKKGGEAAAETTDS